MRAQLVFAALLAASSAVNAAEEGWVVLSVEEFKELRAKARPLRSRSCRSRRRTSSNRC